MTLDTRSSDATTSSRCFSAPWREPPEGQPGVVLVSGDPGIGKSTLLAEAARRTGTPLYLGRCVHVGGDAIPLAPLVDLIRQVRRGSDAGRLRALESLGELATSGAERVGDLFTLALELVGELGADGPVIVGFDDLHWGDPATWDLFEHLARNLVDERVVLVGAYRADEVVRDPEACAVEPPSSVASAASSGCTLVGLDRNAVAVHAAAVLGIPAPPALVDELVRRGEGNPFFTEELVAAHLAGEAIPALLSELLEADIASLDPAGRHVLAALATVGRDTDPELLAAVVELDEPTTEAAVRAAIDARLLVVDAATDAYRVRHPLIGEVAYNAALPTERRRLHRAVATALQAHPRFALTATDAAGELAFHLDRAGDEAAAFEALFAAADSAERIAPATCLAHLERIFELWERMRDSRAPTAAGAASLAGRRPGQRHRPQRTCRRAGPTSARSSATRPRDGHGRTNDSVDSCGHRARSRRAPRRTRRQPPSSTPPLSGTRPGRPRPTAVSPKRSSCSADSTAAEHWARRALETAGPAGRRVAIGCAGACSASWRRSPASSRSGSRTPAPRSTTALAPHRWALANAMLAMVLFDVGQTEEALSVALDGAALSTARRLRDELRDLPRRRRGPVLGAPRPLGGGRHRPRRRRVAGVDPDRRHPARRRRCAAGRPPRTARGRCATSPNAFVAIPLIRSATRSSTPRSSTCIWRRSSGTRPIDIASSALSPKPDMAPRLSWPASPPVWSSGPSNGPWTTLARQEAVDLDAILLDLGRRMDVAHADPGSGSPTAAADIAIAEAMITRLRQQRCGRLRARLPSPPNGSVTPGSPPSPGSTRPRPR